jgi:predicted GNAT family N-acyltransferase
LEVRLARNALELDAALSLRERVFCGEQGVSHALEQDGLDPQALHVVAVEGDEVVGTCRLVLREGVALLGRMAVEPERRGGGVGGVGARILAAAESAARAERAEAIRLHAQLAARALYRRGGYAERGDVFVEAGIEHVTMEKPLA